MEFWLDKLYNLFRKLNFWSKTHKTSHQLTEVMQKNELPKVLVNDIELLEKEEKVTTDDFMEWLKRYKLTSNQIDVLIKMLTEKNLLVEEWWDKTNEAGDELLTSKRISLDYTDCSLPQGEQDKMLLIHEIKKNVLLKNLLTNLWSYKFDETKELRLNSLESAFDDMFWQQNISTTTGDDAYFTTYLKLVATLLHIGKHVYDLWEKHDNLLQIMRDMIGECRNNRVDKQDIGFRQSFLEKYNQRLQEEVLERIGK